MTSRYLRIALIVGSVVGLLSASYLYSALSDQSLSASPLVSEAVNRVREHPGAVEALGESIDASGSVKGTVREYKSNWGEATLSIMVTGSNGEATLHLRAGRVHGPWVFTELGLSSANGGVINLLEPSARPQRAKLETNLRVYVVPLGEVGEIGLEKLRNYYRDWLDLSVEVLAPLALEPKVRNSARGQLIAEELVALMKRQLPHLANDKTAVLIGITNEDMYLHDWPFADTYWGSERAGIVSSARFTDPLSRFRTQETPSQTRVRKLISRVIGILVYKLPFSEDPTSVLAKDLYGDQSTDLMSESFIGLGSLAVVDEFKRSHAGPKVSPELLQDTVSLDESRIDGRYPCLLLQRTRNEAGERAEMKATMTRCLPRSFINSEVDEIEVDLRTGLLMTRTTDLYVPDAIPLAVTRCYRLWDNRSKAFGYNTALSWDIFPIGSRHPYTYIDLILCDGRQVHFDRVSKGTGYADALYEHRQTASEFLSARFGWNGNGWDLKQKDGSLLLFPESYHAKRSVDGALVGLRNSSGDGVKMERGKRRNLAKITLPSGRFISFEYDSGDRITKVDDDQRRTVNYEYDLAGRLVKVATQKSVSRYSYDGTYLKAVDLDGGRLLDLEYLRGRIAQISFGDRRSYRFRYDYDPRDDYTVMRAYVTDPDGLVTKFDISPK